VLVRQAMARRPVARHDPALDVVTNPLVQMHVSFLLPLPLFSHRSFFV
jgi:hypothetical protein